MVFRNKRTVGIFGSALASRGVVEIVKRGAAASLAAIAVAAGVLGVRQLGTLEGLELVAFDHLVRWRPQQAQLDPRILVVTITEQDLQRQQHWPISDRVLAQVLSKLQALKPQVIGLDLYRNLPVEPGHEELVAQLRQPNLIAIRNIDPISGVPAPLDVPPERVGFNEIPTDSDNIVRRNLLFAENEQGTLFSFSLQLAFAYLQAHNISPQSSQQNPLYLQLGPSVFVPLKPNSGGYQKLDAAGYQILLNYRHPKTGARQVSLSQVLDGSLDPNWVKGKIVIIGSTAPSLKDLLATPYSAVLKTDFKMPGVLIHAQMTSQLLDAASGKRPLFWFWPEWAEVLWIVGWIAMGGILGRITDHPLTLSIGVAVGLGACTGICLLLFTQAGWVPLAAPALGFLLCAGVVVSYRSYQAQQKQKIVMKLLGQNTSPQIAQALWQGRDRLLKSGKLPGISLTATMLFADIKDFSSVSEQMLPESLLEWLNELLNAITQEVIEGQGIVNKFTGDGVMAAFGVPTNRLKEREVAQDARAAVACALAISDRLEEMNQSWQRIGLPAIQMRIGIFTGPVVAGSLGGKDRLEYGVIGDSVNIASRLESCEKHRQPTNCRILIGYETLVHLQEQFEVESWGLLALKGKQQMVDVYRVVGARRDKHPSVITSERNC